MNKNAVADLDLDARYLQGFVAGLDEPLLLQIFEELRQTIDLLRSDNTDEFYSIDTRMKKYSNVNPLTGPVLLEKYVFPPTSSYPFFRNTPVLVVFDSGADDFYGTG